MSSIESTNVVQMYEDVVDWLASKNDNSTVTSFLFKRLLRTMATKKRLGDWMHFKQDQSWYGNQNKTLTGKHKYVTITKACLWCLWEQRAFCNSPFLIQPNQHNKVGLFCTWLLHGPGA